MVYDPVHGCVRGPVIEEHKPRVCSICKQEKELLTIGLLNPNVGSFCRDCWNTKMEEVREVTGSLLYRPKVPNYSYEERPLTGEENHKLRKLLDRFDYLLQMDPAPDPRKAMNNG